MSLVVAAYLLLVLVGAPLLSWRTARAGLLRSLPRVTLYRASVGTAWFLAFLGIAALLWDTGLSGADVGLRGLAAGPLALATAATLAALLAGTALFAALRRLTRRPESAEFHHLVPRTRPERLWFAGVAVTAGLTEEFVYRGVVLTALSRLPWFDRPGGIWVAAAVVALGFGLGHGYQDAVGMTRAGALGFLLAVPLVTTGSLLPGTVAHALLDLALLTGPGRALAGVPPTGNLELSPDGVSPASPAGASSGPSRQASEPPGGDRGGDPGDATGGPA